jgi:RNA polymerase sigma-70 factor (ECF subfamily)
MEPLVFEHSPLPPADAVKAAHQAEEKPAKPANIGALFEAEESGLLRFALGLVGRRMVAEELVQETFLRLHKVWAEVENPRAWLYRSLRNLALNHLRDHPQEAELTEATAHSGDSLPVETLGRNEAVGLVRLLIAELPENDRGLVRLKYHDDLRYEEISKRTGLSVGNVGYRLHHVLKTLAEALRHAGIEGSQG